MSTIEIPPSRAVRVRVAFGPYSKGYVITAMPASQRQEMIRRGFVEPVEPSTTKRGGARHRKNGA